MTSPAHDATPATEEDRLRAEVERLRTENRQIHQALAAHAVIDQAIGVLTVLRQITPRDGFTVLRAVSQHTNARLTAVAEPVLKHAQGGALPEELRSQLGAALARHAGPPSGGPTSRQGGGRTCSLKFPHSRAKAFRIVEHVVSTGSWPADARWVVDR
ncbi:ANTAR domain-containing protein [Streptomyces echinatus]|uniref:ANTAR domain-containing protein n=1 Tax=Streptomyces echinatus TaxID=67293 RepID=UPI00381A1B2F